MDRQAFLVGALGGIGVGLLGWLVIENRVRAALREEIPQQVEQQMASQLTELGITPQVATTIRTVADSLDRAGIL